MKTNSAIPGAARPKHDQAKASDTMFGWLRRGKSADGVPVGSDEVQFNSWHDRIRVKVVDLQSLGYQVVGAPAPFWVQVVAPAPITSCELWVLSEVKVFLFPSAYGIQGGRISKLIIRASNRPVSECVGGTETLFCFDRGLVLDKLWQSQKARALYADLIRILN